MTRSALTKKKKRVTFLEGSQLAEPASEGDKRSPTKAKKGGGGGGGAGIEVAGGASKGGGGLMMMENPVSPA